MTDAALSVSVIVVSRSRPDHLGLCLTGLAQQYHPAFEVVVVADAAGAAAVRDAGLSDRVKLLPSDQANVSAARNAGLLAAAGEVVAFIDDDAVPEPTWLSYLSTPFRDPEVSAAGGYVRGRNGISFQWKAQQIDREGNSMPIEMPDDRAMRFTGEPGLGTKTEGTNMAFRRNRLLEIGGFDPAFRYYLDEADLNLRLARTNGVTVIEPRAQVHHAFAKNQVRRGDRVPRDLTEIGASLAAFQLRHNPEGATQALMAQARAGQRRRLLRHMVSGRVGPTEVPRILAGFDRGWDAGLRRIAEPLAPLEPDPSRMLPYVVQPLDKPLLCLIGHWTRRGKLLDEARAAVRAGRRVSLWLYSFTGLRHRVWFDPSGIWVQSGGVFGASERSDPHWRFWSRRTRLERETARVGTVRVLNSTCGNVPCSGL